MKTMTVGGAGRRETTETVRGRMAQLFDPEEDGLDPPAPSPEAPEPGLRHGLLFDRRAVLGLAVLLVLAVGYAVQHFWLGRPQQVAVPAVVPAVVPGSAAASASVQRASPAARAPAEVVIDIAGKVQHPGLRALPVGARVADALRAAGGLLPDADTTGLNLARVLTDGEQLTVGIPAPPVAPATPTTPLNLNHATTEQLDALPGVGPALAQRITLFRRDHGGFQSLDQLRQITGIGDRKFLDLCPLLTL
ncbi:ComEA family DNA-binding protein [Kitasatospora sp. NPDC002227]|uniref:ComEA family DNA-binding protein n=1 Tax=Kitasatospora sp. NPDC002227 TaxID=3154773 RepID=UPI00332728FC